MGKAFAGSDSQYGYQWSVTLSHELLEMLADPDGVLAVPGPADASPFRLYSRRVCDPCASPSHGYSRGGRLVSDFVYPAWFDGRRLGSEGMLDHRAHVSEPFQVLPGGTIDFVELETAPRWMLHSEGSQFDSGSIGPDRLAWPP